MLDRYKRRQILHALLLNFGTFILKLIRKSLKVRFHGTLPPQNALILTWHENILYSPFCLSECNLHGKNISLLASPHADGQLIARAVNEFVPINIIKGSSKKNPILALRESLKLLKNPDNYLAISPDGPRGPAHSVAGGAIHLSQKLHVPIIAVKIQTKGFWRLPTWDGLKFPKPFSEVDFFLSEPLYLDELSLEQAKEFIKKALL